MGNPGHFMQIADAQTNLIAKMAVVSYYYVTSAIVALTYIPYATAEIWVAWINPTTGAYLSNWTKI